jgi:hypothetical protein
MFSNITDKNRWENCISLDFDFRGLSGPQNQQKLEPTINNDFIACNKKIKKIKGLLPQ